MEVHGESLLLIIRTCFNIHLFSREKVTQETASGSLVQMISRILARMEEQPEVPRAEALQARSVSQLDSRRGAIEENHIDHSSSAVLLNGSSDEIHPVNPEVAELLQAMITAVSNGKGRRR